MIPSVVELRRSGQFKKVIKLPKPAVVIGGTEDSANRFLQSGTSIEYFMNRNQKSSLRTSLGAVTQFTPTQDRRQSDCANGFSRTMTDFKINVN